MDCPKCKGLMVYEGFEDYLETRNFNVFEGWRCISCGNISDPMIDSHQKKRIPVIRSTTFRRWRH
jgi:hypothetical protein